MKKFLLVLFVGVALTMDVYGLVNQVMSEEVEEIDHIAETTTRVYME